MPMRWTLVRSKAVNSTQHIGKMLMQFQGTVERASVASGSKSEHRAVVLMLSDGTVKLRRPGGNPFCDPELEKLIGKEIICDGDIQSGQLVLSNWHVVPQ